MSFLDFFKPGETNSFQKIKLVRTPYFTFTYNDSTMKHKYFPPLALGVLSSYLKEHGIEVEKDDLNVKVHYDNFYGDQSQHVDATVFYDKERILSYLAGVPDDILEMNLARITAKTNLEDTDLLLLSVASLIDISPLHSTLALSYYWKKKYKNLKIVVGGAVSHDQVKGFQDSGILDYVIEGPGEKPLVELITALRQGQSLEKVTGLRAQGSNGKEIRNPGCASIVVRPDFDGLPLEKYSFDPTIDPIEGFKKIKKSMPVLPVRWMVSCPFSCAFCCESAGGKFSNKTPEEAVDYLEYLVNRHGTRYFHLLHSTHNLTKIYTHKFCDEIIKRKLNIFWTDCACVRNTDLELLQKMRAAGCIRLIYGMETASPRLLAHIGNTPKVPSMEMASEALKNSHIAGIWAGVEIITGLPTETQVDIDITIKFLNDNKEYINMIFLNPFFLDNQSLMLKNPQKYGITNIQEIGKRATPNEVIDVTDTYFYPYSFDEIDGLKWPEKRRQIIDFNRQFHEKAPSLFWSNETIPLLFHLYDTYGDKATVQKIYAEWVDHRRKNPKKDLVHPPSSLAEHIQKRRSANATFADTGACVTEVKFRAD